jgi:hypothetical protein
VPSAFSKGAVGALSLLGSTLAPVALVSTASPAAAELLPPAGPPTVVLVTQEPATFVASTGPAPVHIEWGANESYVPGHQAGGVRSMDVRYSVEGVDGYVYPSAWQGLPAYAVVDDDIPSNTGRCYSARATDNYGTSSPWTEPLCEYVDGSAGPVTGAEGGTAEFVPWTKGKLAYTWSSPSRGVDGYDISTRVASAGRGLAAWAFPAQYMRTYASSGAFPVSGAGTEHCLRFRVRDVLGRLSAWSTGRCTALPTDDRSLTRRGSTALARSGLAIGGTYTKLAKKGASLTLAKPAGRKVGLWLLRGPGQGTANVYAGTRLIGRVSGASGTNRRDLVVLAPKAGFTGALKVVQAGTKPVRLDAVSVLR